MKGNKVFWFLVMLLILVIGLMLIPSKVGASSGGPTVTVYDVVGGYVIRVKNPDGYTCDIGHITAGSYFADCWMEGDEHAVSTSVHRLSGRIRGGYYIYVLDSEEHGTTWIGFNPDTNIAEVFCLCKCVDNTITYTDDVDKPKPTDKPDPVPDPTKTVPKKNKCNAGRGNGSEGSPDCDPGNSGDHNQGGD